MEFVEPSPQPHPNVLLYGPPKTGKTAAAATSPGRLLYLNADLSNASRIAHQVAHGRIAEPKLYPVGSRGEHDNGNILETMMEIGHLLRGDNPPDGVIVDPTGELYRRLLEEQSKRAMRPTLPTYGDVGVYIERFLRAICESPKTSAIIVCHDMPIRDESTGEVERLPNTGTSNPKMGRTIMGMVDVIGYTGVIQKDDNTRDYVAQLVTQNGRIGGDRFACLDDGRGYRELDLADWFKVIGEASTIDNTTDTNDAPKAQEATAS